LAHEDDVMALTISYDSLFSGSADGVIKRWNRNFDCIQTAIGHEGIVLALTFAGPYLVSGAGDNNVKVSIYWQVA
jgi:di- and tripeptidase